MLHNQTTAYDLVVAWDFFRRVYLGGAGKLFYKNGFEESPEFHADMVYDLGEHARNATAAPRGSAKSTVIGLEIPLLLSLTRPHYEIALGLSTDRQVEIRFDKLIPQLIENELILKDFGVVKPKRGRAIWNHHHLTLRNGAVISGQSVMGKKRGGRPQLYLLDDPENDPDSESQAAAQAVVEKFEVILFRQIIPMLESGSSIYWVGTLINRRSFLYHATTGDDPRFDYWNRKVLKAIAYDKEDSKKVYVLWPEKWSQEVLEARRGEIGPSAFASEYCNEPVSDQERILVIDPRKNEYTVEGEFDWNNPLVHTGLIKWSERFMEPGRRVYKDFEKPYNELVAPMYRILLFDYGQGLSQYNDYSCIAILGFDTNNTLWILDVWLGRAKDATLLRLIYEKGLAWRPRVLGIEAVSIQMSFAEAVQEYIEEMENKTSHPWRARVFPITYPSKVTKGQRICGLEWRYRPGRIKYPAHLAGKWPFDQLYNQTEDFTPDLALLPHDDVIDTLSMCQYVVKNRGGKFTRETGKPGLLERIRKNLPLVRGMPLLSGVNTAEVTGEMLDILSHRSRKSIINPNDRRIVRGNRNIVG
ncbi:hypothetical protein LCGC14_0579120 [marine sediment metagenome]|uniref:Terminase large subunit gp17-like C-terminal domain-containing protein n=1 Tax=marine sediment metagenome TaxID=412755 RepID=A0A0F9UQ91_9ZZZZ